MIVHPCYGIVECPYYYETVHPCYGYEFPNYYKAVHLCYEALIYCYEATMEEMETAAVFVLL